MRRLITQVVHPMLESTDVSDLPAHLARCEERIGYAFRDRELLCSALTHASGSETRLASNERLEFLGDAILGAAVCEILFRRFPDYLEGDLTKIKSIVVSRQTCAKVSGCYQLDEFLFVGKGMATAAKIPTSLLADVFEALLAAVYLDGGDAAAKSFVDRFISPEIDEAASNGIAGNFKSHLQQLAQREFGSTPVYRLLDEKGPDHSKCFKVAAQIGGQLYSAAWGRNKKESEQRAASNAISELNAKDPPFPADD